MTSAVPLGSASPSGGAGPRVVLVGTMGAGKSTVARLLAQAWSTGSRDTDDDIEASTGRAIPDIFVESGEAEFRRLEREAVGRALDEFTGVLSLGGGAVLAPETRAALVGHRVVFLKVGLADAVQRVGLGVGRPMLLGNVRSRVKQLLDERTGIYTEVATHVVETDGRTASDVADEVRRVVEAAEEEQS